MQVMHVKYSEKEEKILFIAFIFGALLGLPIGVTVNYLLGFLKSSGQVPTDFYGWVLWFLCLISKIGIFWLAITAILIFLCYKKERLLNSWYDVGKILWFLFIFFPVMFSYVSLVYVSIFIPLSNTTPWLSPIKEYWLHFFLFLPFVYLFFVIFLPDQKPRKDLIRFLHILKGEERFPRPSPIKVVTSLLIFVWLLLVFSPTPQNTVARLIIIGGGLAILIYLLNQRINVKRNRKRKDSA